MIGEDFAAATSVAAAGTSYQQQLASYPMHFKLPIYRVYPESYLLCKRI